MSRFVRQTAVLALILLWNAAGVYATVCSSRCAEDEYAQKAPQALLAGPAHGSQVRNSAAQDPSRPDACCTTQLRTKKCVTGASSIQQPEFSSAQPLAAALTLLAYGFAAGAGPRTYSPPGFPSGRALCHKLFLLRV